MEMRSPLPCPSTVTVRRNPVRKARATPASAIPIREPLSSPSISRDIFSTEVSKNLNLNSSDDNSAGSSSENLSENLKVFLRVRPQAVRINKREEPKNAWPRNAKIKNDTKPKIKRSSVTCVKVNEDLKSVTVSTPQALQETKRIKSEVYEGFSHVFTSDASQIDVYEVMVKPLVKDFMQGKSALLAAMGPSGSGKTHTVFGCARDPGMVPLALRCIFNETETSANLSSRVFYLSMFEISSEKGKAERMTNLLHDGLQEAVVRDAQQAESIIAQGMLKRATAVTNSNSQSSRSQCIITIRFDSEKGMEEVDGRASSAMFTIADLAGAEREKKTGNQGARLLESNFINNTSMVFGLCLRSLLEHQKNQKRPLPKHYQNSLLTKYLRDYLEGKKRMMLILTVKPGEEDYLDTSFLLRQAAPFTKIKFKTLEEPVNLTCNKRPNQAFPRLEQHKKIKISKSSATLTCEGNVDRGVHLNMQKVISGEVVKDCLDHNIESTADENSNGQLSLNQDYSQSNAAKDREFKILQGLSKALWKVLKQYKEKLEGIEIESCHLKDGLSSEKSRNMDLENELTNEKLKCSDLKRELEELKSRCTCSREASADVFPVLHDTSSNVSQYEVAELQANTEVSSCSFKGLKQTENEDNSDSSVSHVSDGSCGATSVECQNAISSQDFGNPKDAEGELSKLENANLHSVLNSSGSPREDGIGFNVDEEQLNHEEEKEQQDPLVSILPKEGWNDENRPECMPLLASSNDFQQKIKPKRRLPPASALLVKDINTFLKDENDKPKGERGGKTVVTMDKIRTPGSLSLLNLLTSKN